MQHSERDRERKILVAFILKQTTSMGIKAKKLNEMKGKTMNAVHSLAELTCMLLCPSHFHEIQ